MKNSSLEIYVEWSGLVDVVKDMEAFCVEISLDKKLKDAQNVFQLLNLEQSLIIPESEKFEVKFFSRRIRILSNFFQTILVGSTISNLNSTRTTCLCR